MDFIVDSHLVLELTDAISEGVATVDENIEYTYNAVDAMNDGWGGEEYEEYRRKAYSYKSYLDAIKSVYRVYAHMLQEQFLIEAFLHDFGNGLKEALDLMEE